MKVCVVNPNYYRSSGVTVAIRQIFQSVKMQGVEQYFVDCRYGTQEEDVEWIPAGKLQTFLLMENHPLRLAQQIGAFLRWLKREQIQVVHVHHRRLAALLNPLQGLGRFRLVYTAALSYPNEAWFRFASPWRGVAVTASVADNLRVTSRIQHAEVIGNPSHFPSECPVVRVEAAPKRVICIARLEPVKGHRHLIDAWGKLAERGVAAQLILVGEGTLRQALMDQVDALGLKEHVVFYGFQKDVSLEIDRCLFAVLVSEVEGQGIVIVEAAAQGKPTLVTNVDGSRDGVPGDSYMPNLVSFGDPEKLADMLTTWLMQPDAVIQEGRVFYEYHKRQHSMDVVGQKYATLYQRLLR